MFLIKSLGYLGDGGVSTQFVARVWDVDIKAQDCTSESIVLLSILVSFFIQKLYRDVNEC
jgi:hypothetical protein